MQGARHEKPLPGRGSDRKGRRMKYFLCVIGMVMILEGVPYFAFPEKMKAWIVKVLELPDATLRKFGFVLMAAGLFLVYVGRA